MNRQHLRIQSFFSETEETKLSLKSEGAVLSYSGFFCQQLYKYPSEKVGTDCRNLSNIFSSHTGFS